MNNKIVIDKEQEEKVAEQIRARMVEEKRKAEIRQEMKMKEQRDLAAKKKEFKGLPPRPTPTTPVVPPITATTPPVPPIGPNPPVATPNEPLPDGNDFVTKQKVYDMANKINGSFKWLEAFVVAQNAQNAKTDKFIHGLSELIAEYNKK